MKNIKAGDQFGYWTIVEKICGGKHEKWLADCQCGKRKEIYLDNLVRGKSVSCGCFRSALFAVTKKTHGETKTCTYKTWAHIKDRCLNPACKAYKHYGARGIQMCERWQESYENFVADMGRRTVGFSIERINVNGHYEPNNCKWIDKRLQAQNKTTSRFTFNDVTKIVSRLNSGETAVAIAKEYGVGPGHIRQIKRKEIWANAYEVEHERS